MSNPVKGSATAEMSLLRRVVPQPELSQSERPCCQGGAVKRVLHPPPEALNCSNSLREGRPLLFHTDSLLRAPLAFSLSDVPPMATTVGREAGAFGIAGALRNAATKSQLW